MPMVVPATSLFPCAQTRFTQRSWMSSLVTMNPCIRVSYREVRGQLGCSCERPGMSLWETHFELEHRGWLCESVIVESVAGRGSLWECSIGKVGLCAVGLMGDGSCQGRSEVSQVGEIPVGVDSKRWWCTSLTFGSLGTMYDKAALNTSKLKKKKPYICWGFLYRRNNVELGPRKAESRLRIDTRED